MKRFLLFSVIAVMLFMNQPARTENVTLTIPVLQKTYSAEQLEDSSQLAAGFISKTMAAGMDSFESNKASAGKHLSGPARNMYSLITADILSVANGKNSSTKLVYSAEEVYEKTTYTKEELGVNEIFDNSGYTQEAIDAIHGIIYFGMDSVVSALLLDCPYELYWFDKTKGVGVGYPISFNSDGESISIDGSVTVGFPVASEYAKDGQTYVFDTSYGINAQAASENAREIVSQFAGQADESILRGYANKICERVSYNYDALNEEVPYGNPWQLIWVFDDDPDTKVVCEGYAKAYQYLCDLTDFSGNTRVITVSGDMDGEAHLWNVIMLNPGENYLADITNIDLFTIGYPDHLLLAEYDSGNYKDGYCFIVSDETIKYEYDEQILSQYTPMELVLTGKDGVRDPELKDILILPAGLEAIEQEAFTGAACESVILPDGCRSIGEKAFAGCTKLRYVWVPKSVTSIAEDAFLGCTDVFLDYGD